MSQDVSFRRKIIYFTAIALLLYPLYRLGQPATQESGGGVLAELKTKHGFAQVTLGEIDPASESMKLATLGMRGVAANILWEKSNTYKMKEDWDNCSATLKQITKLQPNFIAVWEFQGHNLAYNISAEFDDYRQRYHWVKKGLSFLVEGTHYNRENPRLLHQLGWDTGQKIGRSDEHEQFRKMFRVDEDFHTELNEEISVDEGLDYAGKPDNWLIGRLWYMRGQSAVDSKGIPLKGKSPLLFNEGNPKSLINYSAAIEDEGQHGDDAMLAWEAAGRGWEEYGRRQIPTSKGYKIRLADLGRINDDIADIEAKFDELLPGGFESRKQEKIDKLTAEQQEALAIPSDELTDDNYQLHWDAVEKTRTTYREVAERVTGDLGDRLMKLAGRHEDKEILLNRTDQYRNIVNYGYWETRCQAEKTRTAVDAREFLYDAKKAHARAALEEARTLYEKSWKLWRELYDEFPDLMLDVEAQDIAKAIGGYARLLMQLDEELPADFPLYDFLEQREQDLDDYLKEALAKSHQKESATEEPTTEEPTTEEPTTEEPATEEPATEEPATEEPATEEPATEEPATEEPATEEPATEEPATEEPATEEPATEESATEEPATEEPATEEPATEEPATEEQANEEQA